ncbi:MULTISPECIES: serine/threonine-protein kinase [unclassified Nostoc]|uniref:serine/threonine-protein kinase n=1 Tax=unclassified Nostoc TaxID=2593658 RepID=UPI00262980A7|nr:serine/threonine-protein kinase [Nostoc sp. S13]MDF5734117.1 serine/threonine-protein kinase [Nostoc sp. S13]
MNKNLFNDRWEKTQPEPIGQGGQGSIYLVKDVHDSTTPEKTFALKKLTNNKRLLRFKQEIETILELNKKQYSGIFPILDYSFDKEPYYFVTEYYGNNILSKNAPMEVIPALINFIKICETVSYIHDNNIVHRDLKPDNIVLDDKEQPIILDFGLCFNFNLNLNSDTDDDLNDSFRLTQTIEQIGSRFYIPPELENGRTDKISKQSDSYTLGKILYFLLTGKTFSRENYDNLATLLNNSQLDYITGRILSKTVIENVESRLTSANIREEAIKIKRLISGGFYPNKIDSICRFCGEGIYKAVQSGLLKTSLYPEREPNNKLASYYLQMTERSLFDSSIPFEAIACNVCGNMQFFIINQSDL